MNFLSGRSVLELQVLLMLSSTCALRVSTSNRELPRNHPHRQHSGTSSPFFHPMFPSCITDKHAHKHPKGMLARTAASAPFVLHHCSTQAQRTRKTRARTSCSSSSNSSSASLASMSGSTKSMMLWPCHSCAAHTKEAGRQPVHQCQTKSVMPVTFLLSACLGRC